MIKVIDGEYYSYWAGSHKLANALPFPVKKLTYKSIVRVKLDEQLLAPQSVIPDQSVHIRLGTQTKQGIVVR